MSHWAVAQTEPQRERVARIWLMRSGFETYLPRIRLQSGQIRPLFPTYLFVRVVAQWYPIAWTPGVVRLLMSGEKPASLPDGDIRRLRQAEVRGFVRLPKDQRRPGTSVKIVRGLFVGRLAVFESMTGEERARVLLELLGQKTTVELPAADLQDVAS